MVPSLILKGLETIIIMYVELMVLVLAVIVIGAIIVVARAPKTKAPPKKGKWFRQGMGYAIGMISFTVIWALAAISLDMPGMIGIGPAVGFSVGLALEQANGTYEEKRKATNQKKALTVVLAGLVAVAVAILVLYLAWSF